MKTPLKIIITALVIFVFATLFIWGLYSFYYMDTNPANWSEVSRGGFALLDAIIMGISIGISAIIYSE